MKQLGLMLWLFVACVVLGNATNVTKCQTITASGTYTLTTNLTQVSPKQNCLTIIVTDGGTGVVLDGNGFTLTDTSSPSGGVDPGSLILITNSNVPVTVKNFAQIAFTNDPTDASLSFPGIGPGGECDEGTSSHTEIYTSQQPSIPIIQINNEANGKQVEISNNVIKGGTTCVYNSPNTLIFGNNMTHHTIPVYYSPSVNIESNTINNTGLMASQNTYGISVWEGGGHIITNNTITGQGSVEGDSDDGILLISQDSFQSQISNNTISKFWDCGIEIAGYFDASSMNNNILSNIGTAGICGYWGDAAIHSSTQFLRVYNSSFIGNRVTGGAGSLMRFWPQGGDGGLGGPGGQFYLVNISNNTMASATNASYIGQSSGNGAHFASWARITINSNNFGPQVVNVNQTSQITSDGLNKCSGTSPANAFVCNSQ